MSILKRVLGIFTKKKKEVTMDKANMEEVRLSEDVIFLRKLIDENPNPIYYIDERGIVKYCNTAFTDYFDTNKEKILGREFSSLCDKEAESIYCTIGKCLACSKEKQTYTARIKRKGEPSKHVIVTQSNLKKSYNEERGSIGNMTEISQLLMSERKISRLLKLKEAMLEINHIIIKENDINILLNLVLEKVTTAMEKADIGCVLILDKDENLKIVASRGYDEEEVNRFSIKLSQAFYMKKNKGVIGKTTIIDDIQSLDLTDHQKVLDSKDSAKLRCSISTPILLDGKLYGFINIESTYNNAFDENDIEVLDYLKKQIEVGISKNKLYEETIYLSRYDKLTNIYNRGYFEELLNKSIAAAERNGQEFLLVVFDLNWLKVINDTYGHLAGDELIRNFAAALKHRIGAENIAARIGGDEFSAIVYDMDTDTLTDLLEELIKKFKANPISFERHNFVCSFSYGIASFPRDGLDYNALVKAADMRMYEYKQKIRKVSFIQEK